MRTLRIYALTSNLSICAATLFARVIMLYVISLGLIYLRTESLYFLTTFFQFPLPAPASCNHKSDLFL